MGLVGADAKDQTTCDSGAQANPVIPLTLTQPLRSLISSKKNGPC